MNRTQAKHGRGRARQPAALLVAMLVCLNGCAGKATLEGTVTYQGRPVVYGSVVVLSADKTARSGVIRPDGRYTVEGIQPGEVRIAVISREPAKGRKAGPSGTERPTGWFAIPLAYEDPATSGLRLTVGG